LWGAASLLALPLGAAQVFALLASLEAPAVAPALLGGMAGALAADGATGLVHWACDTWGDARTPVVGSRLIAGFREHHRDPSAMLAHHWVEVNREPAVAAGAVLLMLWLLPARDALAARPALHAFLLVFVAYGASANQLHYWAHQPDPPRAVRWLQKSGAILSPERHARHHRAPSTNAYCISTGWLNGLLDATGAWRRLERGITRLTGAVPRVEPRAAGPSGAGRMGGAARSPEGT
jgi:ubiquitin-conjugating enzyme E2 variant